MRARVLFAAAVLATASLSLPLAGASAQVAAPPGWDGAQAVGEEAHLAPALPEDPETRHPPADRTQDELEWSVEFARVATHVKNAYPDDFSYAGLADDYVGAYIAFAGAVPDGLAEAIGGVSRVELIADAGFTRDDLLDYQGGILRSVTPEGVDGAFAVVVDNDPLRRVFDVTISGVEGFESSDAGAASSAQLAGIEEDIVRFVASAPPPAGFAVTVLPAERPVAGFEWEDGGRSLAGVCTGAFPVKRNAGPELGILTAGHCPGTGSYGSTSDMFYPPYPYSLDTKYNVNTGGDFRWNHSRYLLSGYTYLGGEGGRKRFARAEDPWVGSQVCHYGRTTGHGCDTVRSLNSGAEIYVPDGHRVYEIGPLVRTWNSITRPGDSGGPWYFRGTDTAAGIHSGVYGNGSYFSYVTNALQNFGVTLWVG